MTVRRYLVPWGQGCAQPMPAPAKGAAKVMSRFAKLNVRMPGEPPKVTVVFEVDAEGWAVTGVDARNVDQPVDHSREAWIASYCSIANQWMTRTEDGHYITHHAFPDRQEAESKWLAAHPEARVPTTEAA